LEAKEFAMPDAYDEATVQKAKNLLEDIRVDEVSLVNTPAVEGAAWTIIKRDESAEVPAEVAAVVADAGKPAVDHQEAESRKELMLLSGQASKASEEAGKDGDKQSLIAAAELHDKVATGFDESAKHHAGKSASSRDGEGNATSESDDHASRFHANMARHHESEAARLRSVANDVVAKAANDNMASTATAGTLVAQADATVPDDGDDDTPLDSLTAWTVVVELLHQASPGMTSQELDMIDKIEQFVGELASVDEDAGDEGMDEDEPAGVAKQWAAIESGVATMLERFEERIAERLAKVAPWGDGPPPWAKKDKDEAKSDDEAEAGDDAKDDSEKDGESESKNKLAKECGDDRTIAKSSDIDAAVMAQLNRVIGEGSQLLDRLDQVEKRFNAVSGRRS